MREFANGRKIFSRVSNICRLVDLQKLLQGTLLHRFAVKKRWRSGLLFSTNRKNSGHNKLAIVLKLLLRLSVMHTQRKTVTTSDQ